MGAMGSLIHFGGTITRILLHAFHTHQLSALFLLILVEEAGIPLPIPGDTLVMLAGLEPHKTVWYVLTIISAVSLAVFLGSSALYTVARRGGRPVLEKYGKYIHLNHSRLDRMERWFVRRGRTALIFGRLIPGLRIPTTVMAGLSGIPYSVFAPSAALAAVIWSSIYFWLGILINREWRLITGLAAGLLDDVSLTVLLACTLIIAIGVAGGTWHLRRRTRRARRSKPLSQETSATALGSGNTASAVDGTAAH